MKSKKKLHGYVKDALAAEIKKAAEAGRFASYRELAEFAAQKWPKEFPKNDRRRLVDYLDAINRDSRRMGILLSVIVVGNDGMPDFGFFQKLKANEWPMKRLSPQDIGLESDEKIFRREAAKVFRACEARKGIHVFMDLQNIPVQGEKEFRGWIAALEWLARWGRLSGRAYSTDPHKKRKPVLNKHGIQKEDVSKSGKDAADAALLVEFGRGAFRVPDRDFVCIMGSDEIYNQAVELAVRDGINVLRFCGGTALQWEPKSEARFYCAFDINASSNNWDDALREAIKKYAPVGD